MDGSKVLPEESFASAIKIANKRRLEDTQIRIIEAVDSSEEQINSIPDFLPSMGEKVIPFDIIGGMNRFLEGINAENDIVVGANIVEPSGGRDRQRESLDA